jgi:hypothetical protein
MLQEVAVPVRDAGDALATSLGSALGMLVGALPRALGFVVVLVVGWLLATAVGRLVDRLLEAVRFDQLAERAGIASFVRRMGIDTRPSTFVGDVTKWFVRLITLVVAFDLLGLPAVSVVLQQFLLWLPNLVVALVVLVVGGLAARALGNVVRAATGEAGFGSPNVLAGIARAAVLAFAVVVALNQLGIATVLINTLLIGVVGAVALAAGLAFGLGGRDRAAQLLDSLGRRVESAPRQPRTRTHDVPAWGTLAAATAAVGTPGNPAGGPGRGPWITRTGGERRQSLLDAVESGRGERWVARSGAERRRQGAA